MKQFRTWSWLYFGYLDWENLFIYSWKHVSKLINGIFYDKNWFYVWEVINDEYLITKKSNIDKQESWFEPKDKVFVNSLWKVNRVWKVMISWYQDFPLFN